MRITRLILFLAMLLSANNLAQAQTEGCSVSTHFRDLDSGTFSSRLLVGKFLLQSDDNERTEFFRHEESDVNIAVGVQLITSVFKDKPKMIRVAISFTGKPGEAFEMIEGAQAESIFDRHWRWLSVSDKIRARNRIYTFTFSCGREIKKRGR